MTIQMPGYLGFDTGDLLMCNSTRAANATVEKDKEQRHSKCAQANCDDFPSHTTSITYPCHF